MPDPTAPCPVCRAHVPTIDGNLIHHRHRDQLGPCPAGQVPDPGVDEGEALAGAEVGRCEDQFTNLFDRRFWCDLKAGHLGAHREGTTNWASGQSEAFRVHAERDQLRAQLAVVGPALDAARALVAHLAHSPSWKFSSGLTAESLELISRLGIAVRALEEGT